MRESLPPSTEAWLGALRGSAGSRAHWPRSPHRSHYAAPAAGATQLARHRWAVHANALTCALYSVAAVLEMPEHDVLATPSGTIVHFMVEKVCRSWGPSTVQDAANTLDHCRHGWRTLAYLRK